MGEESNDKGVATTLGGGRTAIGMNDQTDAEAQAMERSLI